MPQTNPRWRTAAILKNRKILISLQPIDLFWLNLTCWCVSSLWTPIANKSSRFQKSKMAAAAILKIQKIAISTQWNDWFWRHLSRWWVWAFRTLSANEISQILKSKIAAATILKIEKSKYLCKRLTDFDCIWCYGVHTPKLAISCWAQWAARPFCQRYRMICFRSSLIR